MASLFVKRLWNDFAQTKESVHIFVVCLDNEGYLWIKSSVSMIEMSSSVSRQWRFANSRN
jgi:hypothetical protein